MPSLSRVQQALSFCRQQQIPLTLVTPVFYQGWLPDVEQLLDGLKGAFSEGDELLFSDLGMLALARKKLPELPLICGRALSGQKRGPRILGLELSPAELDYFQRGSWYSSEAVAFLQEQGVERIELDNLLQGIAPLPSELSGSLHRPYALVTSSRHCPFRKPHHEHRCSGGCGEVFRLTTEQTDIPLLQAGNSQFLKNDLLPENLAALGIDRIVEHSSLPA